MKEPTDFPEFLQAVGECGLPHAPADLGLCKAIWAILDRDQKAAAVAGLYQRKECGEFDDAAYRPGPHSYLSKRLWNRPLRIKHKRASTAGDLYREEVPVAPDPEAVALLAWAEAHDYPVTNGAQLATAEAARKAGR